jgi:hypothetical protein
VWLPSPNGVPGYSAYLWNTNPDSFAPP